jgi:hypothetical protein
MREGFSGGAGKPVRGALRGAIALRSL